jgi:hypothetical protein
MFVSDGVRPVWTIGAINTGPYVTSVSNIFPSTSIVAIHVVTELPAQTHYINATNPYTVYDYKYTLQM